MSCDQYKNPSIAATAFAVAFTAGIAISYVPQHLKILHRKTSEGLLPYFLLMGTASGISAFANLVCMSSVGILCCRQGLSAFECAAGQVGVLQVGTQTIAAALILVFCVYCTQHSPFQDVSEYLRIVRVYRTCLWYAGAHVVVVAYTLLYGRQKLYSVANGLGILLTVLASLQYIPQIWTLIKLKHPGSLSVAMMCMQTPGGFAWCLSLYLSPGAIWSSWMPYFAAASLQGILLALCVYYGPNDETQPLVVPENTEAT